jgi:alpha-galactosidase
MIWKRFARRLFLNYTNPMAMLTAAMLKARALRPWACATACRCVPRACWKLGMDYDDTCIEDRRHQHQAWLLEISRDGKDLYPEIKQRAAARTEKHHDMVRTRS